MSIGTIRRSKSHRRRLAAAAAADIGVSPGTTNLQAWWPLNETSGTRYDSHTNAIHLDVLADVGYDTGKVGNATSWITPANGYLSTAHNANLSFGSGSFTIGGWVYQTSNAALNGRWIVSKRDSFEYQFTASISDYYQANFTANPNTYYVDTQGVTPLLLNQWVFFLFGSDSTPGDTHYFIEINNEHFARRDTWSSIGLRVSNFNIGNLRYPNPARPWDGLIDEVFVYSRILTDDEKAWLYNGGAGRTYTDL